MSRASVQQILDLIDKLVDEDRALLRQRLDERAEAEWRLESNAARREAAQRGINQSVIDEAIRKRRYGA